MNISGKSISFVPNSFQTPNAYVDDFLAYLTGDEYKVLSYATRRILGFQKRQDRIAISQFTDGTRNSAGEVLDRGTGLNERTVRKCLARLALFGLMVRIAENDPRANEGVLWSLQWDDTKINWPSLQERADAWAKLHGNQISKARAKRKAPPAVAPDPLPSQDTPPLLWDNSTPPVVEQQPQYTGKSSKEKQREAAATNGPRARGGGAERVSSAAALPLFSETASLESSKSALNRDAYTRSFHEPTQQEEDSLARLEDTYSVEWVKEAIADAAMHNPQDLAAPLAYLSKILERWRTQGRQDKRPSSRRRTKAESDDQRQARITAAIAKYAPVET